MKHVPGEMEMVAEDAAAFWFARMRADDVSGAERAEFQRWLDADPAHVCAYASCQSLWDTLRDAAADEAIVAMRREALALAPERRGLPWPQLTALAATLALFLVAGLLLLRAGPADLSTDTSPLARIARFGEPEIYRTEVGQRSTLTLGDGSVVELNTDSVLQVDFSDRRRDVRLLRGQAMFEVAHDSGRPFVVEAEGRRITALGTAFDVRIGAGKVQVTLIEGRVRVEPVGRPSASAQLAARTLVPGEQLVASVGEPLVVRRADVGRAVSWRTGRVIFSDEPLGDVVEEVNRYSRRKVVLGDPSLVDLRVSGVFRAGSIDGFVDALESAFPVDARAGPDREEVVLTWQ